MNSKPTGTVGLREAPPPGRASSRGAGVPPAAVASCRAAVCTPPAADVLPPSHNPCRTVSQHAAHFRASFGMTDAAAIPLAALSPPGDHLHLQPGAGGECRLFRLQGVGQPLRRGAACRPRDAAPIPAERASAEIAEAEVFPPYTALICLKDLLFRGRTHLRPSPFERRPEVCHACEGPVRTHAPLRA